MSQNQWVQESKKILEMFKEFRASAEGDRLDSVKSMAISIHTIERALAGWLQWVSNLNVMAKFPPKELREMDKALHEYAISFIKYDIKMTERASRFVEKPKERPKVKTEI